MKKVICILIGFAISGAVLFPLFKNRRAEEKVQEEELLRKVDEMTKEALDEELRHKTAMEDIERKGEQELKEQKEKNDEQMKELVKKVVTIIQDDNAKRADGVIHCMKMKYKDKNGVIHEFDAMDSKQLREILKEKTNQLIFN